MSRTILTSALVLCSIAVASPQAEAATCNSGYGVKCVKAIRHIPVRRARCDNAKVICHYNVGDKFYTEKAAGTHDGTRWYTVRFSKKSVGHYSEWDKNHNMTIKNAQGCPG